MVKTEIEKQLRSVIEDTPKDLDWAIDRFQEVRDEAESHMEGSVEEEKMDQAAIQMVRGDAHKAIRQNRGGPAERLNFITIGQSGVREWSDGVGGRKNVLLGYGVVYPEDDEEGIGVFICDETDGAPIEDLQKQFSEVYQPKIGTFQVDRGNYNETSNGTPIYVCRTDGTAPPDVRDREGFSEETRIETVRELVPEAEISNIKEALSKTNEDGYEIDFGADMRRLECIVEDWYDGDGFNVYTVLDDSVVDPEQLPEDIVSGSAPEPGLTAWCPDEFFEYGCDSNLELYGTITRSDDGEISMNVVSAYPLVAFDQEEGKSPRRMSESPPVPEDTIQVCHVEEEGFDVYGGRNHWGGQLHHMGNTKPGNSGWLGNPFSADTLPREKLVGMYEQAFLYRVKNDEDFHTEVENLRGKQVACHCRRSDIEEDHPKCHLDVVRDFLSDTAQ